MSDQEAVVTRLQEEVAVLQGMLANQVMDYSKLKVEESLAKKELKNLNDYCDEIEGKFQESEKRITELQESINTNNQKAAEVIQRLKARLDNFNNTEVSEEFLEELDPIEGESGAIRKKKKIPLNDF